MKCLFGLMLVILLFAVIIPTDSKEVDCTFCYAKTGHTCPKYNPRCTVKLCGQSWYDSKVEECKRDLPDYDLCIRITKCRSSMESKPMLLVTALLPLIAYGSRFLM